MADRHGGVPPLFNPDEPTYVKYATYLERCTARPGSGALHDQGLRGGMTPDGSRPIRVCWRTWSGASSSRARPHESAGNPPVRTRRRVLLVLAPVLDAREFLGAAVLAPPLCGAVLVEDERGVSATCPDPVLLELLAAAPFQASAAAAARSRASSTGLLTMGQWPESMSMK